MYNEPSDDECPEWATGVLRSVKMIEGSEEHVVWKLKYGTVEKWWEDVVKQATKELD